MGRLTGSGSSIWLVASPLINSALASALRPSARIATPAGSTQLSSRVGRWPPLTSNGGQRLGSKGGPLPDGGEGFFEADWLLRAARTRSAVMGNWVSSARAARETAFITAAGVGVMAGSPMPL